VVRLEVEKAVAEMFRQDERWGEQNHPDGTSRLYYGVLADSARRMCDRRATAGTVTWADILREEFYEAVSEEDSDRLYEELIQVAAVAMQWAGAIRRRETEERRRRRDARRTR